VVDQLLHTVQDVLFAISHFLDQLVVLDDSRQLQIVRKALIFGGKGASQEHRTSVKGILSSILLSLRELTVDLLREGQSRMKLCTRCILKMMNLIKNKQRSFNDIFFEEICCFENSIVDALEKTM